MLSVQEFASQYKAKNPQFYKMDDLSVAQMMVKHYPELKSQIDFTGATKVEKPVVVSAPKKTEPVKKEGFFQSIGSSLQKRGANLVQTFKDTASGKINPLQTGIRTVGEVAGGIGDVAGRVVGGAIGVANTVSGGKLKKVGEGILQTELGKEGLKIASAGADAYSKWKKSNPSTAKDLESVLNIASLFPIGKGTQMAGKATANTAKVAGKGVAKVGSGIGEAGKVTTASVTGLSKDTINTLIKNPKAITAAQKAGMDASSLGNKVKTALTSRIEDLRSTGKKYEVIRRSPEKVIIPEDTVTKTLNKFGIELDANGKIVTTVESVPLKAGDKKELQDFIDLFGNQKELSGNAFMNARTNLTNLSGFGTDKSDISKVIAKEIRKNYDDLGKSQLTGLKSLDAKYSAEKTSLSKIKKEYIDKDGGFKDTALSRISNATNEGRQNVLARLEKLIPGISEEINIYKAVRDIEAVKNQKVGAYANNALRSGVGGFAVSGGNVGGAIVGAILSHPSVAVPIIKAYGRIKNINKRSVDNIINKMKSGKSLLDKETKFINSALFFHLAFYRFYSAVHSI